MGTIFYWPPRLLNGLYHGTRHRQRDRIGNGDGLTLTLRHGCGRSRRLGLILGRILGRIGLAEQPCDLLRGTRIRHRQLRGAYCGIEALRHPPTGARACPGVPEEHGRHPPAPNGARRCRRRPSRGAASHEPGGRAAGASSRRRPAAQFQLPNAAFHRSATAQDTGSAIIGPARADLYFGAGQEAGRVSGRLRHAMHFVMLVPKGLDPTRAPRGSRCRTRGPRRRSRSCFRKLILRRIKPAAAVAQSKNETVAVAGPVPLPVPRPVIEPVQEPRRPVKNRSHRQQ